MELTDEIALDELSAAIMTNNSLEKLFLNNNCLGSSIIMIANACCQNSSLKEFSIKNTGISEIAAKDLASFIKTNSIELLSMSENNL